MKIITVLLTALVCCFANATPRIIAIEGKGRIEFQAEVIRIYFSVYNQSEKDVKKAKDMVEKTSKSVVQGLLQLGVDEQDIFSPSFTVDLDTSFDERCSNGFTPIVGRDMEVLVRDVSLYRQVIDLIVDRGVTGIGLVESEVADIKKYERQAMLAAIADAKEQATFLVENLGGELGKVYSIGRKRVRTNSNLEEIVVSGIRASQTNDIPFDYQPEPVEVSAEIYVEFEID